ncbi:MAG: ABC transporter ATP-binding protein/permease [Treponema sp.]|nr:ABC transporter ATP-binding protein/permease [Treponema sp.]
MYNVRKIISGLEKKYRIYSLLSPLSMIGEVMMETAIPLMMAKIIDKGIASKNLSYVIKIGLIMISMSLVSLLFGGLGARFSSVAAFGVSRNLRRKLFSKVQDFSFGNVDHFSSSSLITRLTTDVTNVQNTYQMLIRICIRAPFNLISGTVMAAIISRKLSLLFLVAIPVLALCLTLIARIAYPRFGIMLKQYDLLNNTVQENLIGIRVVKSFVRHDFENEKFKKAADAVRKSQINAEKIVILNLPLMQLVAYSCIIVSLWFGGRMIIAGDMLTGELISFITYITQILMSLMMLSMVFINLIISRASILRVCEILDEEPEIKNIESANKLRPISVVQNGSVDFKNVSFSYLKDSDNCVLSDISLHIESGMVVGIIGGTGSSKTTLVSLIPRLYDTLLGSVQVAGIDVRKYDLVALRNSVAMVLQNNVLFSGTIKENLKWGNETASDKEIKEACIAADADEFVSAFPNGYDTDLGQGGVNLSGGQKQRLCIARALLKKPKVLILDDSTSAVDTATDARIRNALRNTLPDTTKIIIAQRINSVQDADVIFVMDNGKISGSGTHNDLLKNNSIYKEVYESQQAKN